MEKLCFQKALAGNSVSQHRNSYRSISGLTQSRILAREKVLELTAIASGLKYGLEASGGPS